SMSCWSAGLLAAAPPLAVLPPAGGAACALEPLPAGAGGAGGLAVGAHASPNSSTAPARMDRHGCCRNIHCSLSWDLRAGDPAGGRDARVAAPLLERPPLGQRPQLALPDLAQQVELHVRLAQPLALPVGDDALSGLGHAVLHVHDVRVVLEIVDADLAAQHRGRQVVGRWHVLLPRLPLSLPRLVPLG